ncbi:RHS repeat protein, partial [Escherichia coli]|nr:RHS repeat protein [Escherichia coli]
RLTSENGSHTTFRYDVLDRLIQETGFDGRTQRYHHDPGKDHQKFTFCTK